MTCPQVFKNLKEISSHVGMSPERVLEDMRYHLELLEKEYTLLGHLVEESRTEIENYLEDHPGLK